MSEIREVSVEEYNILKTKYGLGDDMMEKIVGVKPMLYGKKWADAVGDDKLEGVEVLNIEDHSSVMAVPEFNIAEAEIFSDPSPVVAEVKVDDVQDTPDVPMFSIPEVNEVNSPSIESPKVEVEVSKTPQDRIKEAILSRVGAVNVEVKGVVENTIKDEPVIENEVVFAPPMGEDEPVIENEVVFAPPMGEDELVIENEVVFAPPMGEDENLILNAETGDIKVVVSDKVQEENPTEGISNSRSEMFIMGADKLKSMFPVKSTINRDVGRVF